MFSGGTAYTAVLIAAALAFGISCLSAFLLVRGSHVLRILDYPNERSLHSEPVPRTGGLAIWAGGAMGIGVVAGMSGSGGEAVWIGIGATVVGVVSLIDDRYHVPVGLRLAVHIIAAMTVLLEGLVIQSSALGMDIELSAFMLGLGTLLFVVWFINLFNFMDGIDGLAGGMAAIGFGTFGLLGWLSGEPLFAAINFAVAAAAVGFLVFNFAPARLFMGDSGSATLGFVAASIILWAERSGTFPLWLGILVFSPFVADATVTLLRRLIRGERVWEAHNSHYYQRLVKLGWGHKKAVLAEYGLMIACAVSAVWSTVLSPWVKLLLVCFWISFYIALIRLISWKEARNANRMGGLTTKR